MARAHSLGGERYRATTGADGMLCVVRTDPFGLSFNRALGSAEAGNRAFFGQDVLQGLIDGIDDFVHERQPRWERHSYRVGAPALLGCSPWITDDALLAAVEKLPGACIVLSKEPKRKRDSEAVLKLRELNESTAGLPQRALSGLAHKAPKISGRPQVLGPYAGPRPQDSYLPISWLSEDRPDETSDRPRKASATRQHLMDRRRPCRRCHGLHLVQPEAAMGLLRQLHLRVAAKPRVWLLD